MALKLNASGKAYQEFYGRNVEQMPKLIADGRVPLPVAGFMQRRLDTRTADEDVKASWMNNYFDTGDARVYHPETKDLLIDLDSEELRGIHPNFHRLRNGSWLLSEDRDEAFAVYERIKNKPTSVLIKAKYLGKTDEWMSKEDVKAHPVWKALARDQALLDDYTDYIFDEYQKRFAKGKPLEDVRAMGIFPNSVQGNTPEMRAWFVGRREDRSGVLGVDDLDNGNGRLVGIAPEAQSAKISGAGNVKSYTMADVQGAVSELEALEKVVGPESLEKVRCLVSKL